MTPALREAFLENPEYVLALMFSAPDQKESQLPIRHHRLFGR